MRKQITLLTGIFLLSTVFAAQVKAQTATATLKGSVADGGGKATRRRYRRY